MMCARLHGGLTCALTLLFHAAATAMTGALSVEVGWLTDLAQVTVPLASFLPALCVLGFYGVTGDPYPRETNAVRPLRAYRWVLLGVLLGFAALTTWLVTATLGDVRVGAVAMRNLVGLLGLTLALRPLLGDASWLCPGLFALVELLFGGSTDGDPAAWAWTLHPSHSDSGLAAAVALAVLGALVLLPRLGAVSTTK